MKTARPLMSILLRGRCLCLSCKTACPSLSSWRSLKLRTAYQTAQGRHGLFGTQSICMLAPQHSMCLYILAMSQGRGTPNSTSSSIWCDLPLQNLGKRKKDPDSSYSPLASGHRHVIWSRTMRCSFSGLRSWKVCYKYSNYLLSRFKSAEASQRDRQVPDLSLKQSSCDLNLVLIFRLPTVSQLCPKFSSIAFY